MGLLDAPLPPPFCGFDPPPEAAAEWVTVFPMPRITERATMPGSPYPNPSPVMAGVSPTRATIPSIFRATLAMPTISSIQGSTAKPEGTYPSAEIRSFRKIMFMIIMRHIEANILHQPLKMSAVFLEPPSPKANGAIKTRMAVTTYRSATSKHSLTNCHIMTMPTMMIRSQDAPILKLLSSGMVMVTLVGT